MSVCRLVGRSIGRLVGRSVCHNFLLWYGSLTFMLQSEHLFSSIHSVSKRCLANDIGFISMSNRQNSTFFLLSVLQSSYSFVSVQAVLFQFLTARVPAGLARSSRPASLPGSPLMLYRCFSV